jgi:surfactin synthase thioesterase subunit
MHDHPEELPADLVAEMSDEAMITGPLRNDLLLFESYAGSHEKLNCPITALGGENDALFIVSTLDRWREHTSAGFGLELVPGGHAFLRTSEDKVIGVIARALPPSTQEARDR